VHRSIEGWSEIGSGEGYRDTSRDRPVWSMQAARLIALLTRIVRDVCVAADLSQDALVAALEQ